MNVKESVRIALRKPLDSGGGFAVRTAGKVLFNIPWVLKTRVPTIARSKIAYIRVTIVASEPFVKIAEWLTSLLGRD